MDEVYSETMYLLESGFRYWFNDLEIEELHRQSSAFHVQTIEYVKVNRKKNAKDSGFINLNYALCE